MALQINQYTKIRTDLTLDNDDLMDLDSTDDAGVSYESAKMTVANLLAFVNANADNIYIADGTILANRTLTANGNWTKWVTGDVKVANVGDGDSFGFVVEFGVVEMGRFNYDVGLTSANIELKHFILGVPTTYLNASNGLVDITGDLKITDGLQALNKVFTSDANGLGSWQYPIVGSGGIYGGDGTILTNTVATLTDNLTFNVGVNKAVEILSNKTNIYTPFATNSGQSVLGLYADSGGTPTKMVNFNANGAVQGFGATTWYSGGIGGTAQMNLSFGGTSSYLLSSSGKKLGLGANGTFGMYLDTLNNVGIGMTGGASPEPILAKLNVKGGTPSTTKTLLIENSLLNPNLVVQDDGFVGVGTSTQSAGNETLGVSGGAKIGNNLVVGTSSLNLSYGILSEHISNSVGVGIRSVVGNTTGGTTITKSLSLTATGNGTTTELYGSHLEDFVIGTANNNAISAYGHFSTIRNNNINAPTTQKTYGSYYDVFTQGGAGTVSAEMVGVYSKLRVSNGDADGKWRAGVFEINSASYIGTDALAIEAIGNSYFNGNVGIGIATPTESLDVNGRQFLSNQTAPATPTGGGTIYVEGGALKYIGSSGTITTLGVA